MSNVTNLFDYKNDDPLILAYIDFFTKSCVHWLDQKLYHNFYTPEALNMLVSIRKLVPRSSELKSAYINFTMRFKDDNSIEFERLQKTIENIENQNSNINALTCSTADWSNLNRAGKPRPQILCAIVAIRILLEQRKFTLKHDVWRLYSIILDENEKEQYESIQIDSILRGWRNLIYGYKGTMYSLETLKDAFHQIAKVNEFHSQQKKIRSITWDGIDRYAAGAKAMGLDSSEFTLKAFRHHLIASAARLFYPGVWYDLVLCVFGDQGAGKTTGLRLLYGRDNVISCNFFELDPKQKSEATRHGIWAVENPDTFGDARKADFNKIKADVSIDSFVGRDAYGRVEDMRRVNITYVIWYTGNEVHVLRDPTGNRRFIIVYSVGPTDEDWLRRESDQLWAQVYIDMEQLRTQYLEEMHHKGINEEYPKYLGLPRELWEESKKRSDAAMVDAPPWEDWVPEIIFQDFVVWSSPKSNKKSIFVLTRDVLKYLHEKYPRSTSIPDKALSQAMTKVVILAKERSEGLHEDIKWTPKQINLKGTNLRGYRIDFEGESKQRAFELIKQNIDSKNKSPEDDFIQNGDSIIGKHSPF
jgi:Virulence-associated protein E